jgi:hypothetical protein
MGILYTVVGVFVEKIKTFRHVYFQPIPIIFNIEMHDYSHNQFMRMRKKSIECELSNI